MDRETWLATVRGVAESDTTEQEHKSLMINSHISHPLGDLKFSSLTSFHIQQLNIQACAT